MSVFDEVTEKLKSILGKDVPVFLDFSSPTKPVLQQVEDEFRRFWEEVLKGRDLRLIVEIGTAVGGSSFFFLNLFPNAIVVSMDIVTPEQYKSSDLGEYVDPVFTFNMDTGRFCYLNTSSKNPTAFYFLLKVIEELKLRGIDFLFVDGEKDYLFDLLLYYPLVAEGGLIAFHDVHIEKKDFIATRALFSKLNPYSAQLQSLEGPFSCGYSFFEKGEPFSAEILFYYGVEPARPVKVTTKNPEIKEKLLGGEEKKELTPYDLSVPLEKVDVSLKPIAVTNFPDEPTKETYETYMTRYLRDSENWFVLTSETDFPRGDAQNLLHNIFTPRCRGLLTFKPTGVDYDLWVSGFKILTFPFPPIPMEGPKPYRPYRFYLKTTNDELRRLCRTVGEEIEKLEDYQVMTIPEHKCVVICDFGYWDEEVESAPTIRICVGPPPKEANPDGVIHNKFWELFSIDKQFLPFYFPVTVNLWEDLDWYPPVEERPDKAFIISDPIFLSKHQLSSLDQLSNLYDIVSFEEGMNWTVEKFHEYRFGVLLVDQRISVRGEHPFIGLCSRYGTPLFLTGFAAGLVHPLTMFLTYPTDPKDFVPFFKGLRVSFEEHFLEGLYRPQTTILRLLPIRFVRFIEELFGRRA